MAEPFDFTAELVELRRTTEETAGMLSRVAATLRGDCDIADTARALAEFGEQFAEFGEKLTRYFRAAIGQPGDVPYVVTGDGTWVATVSEAHVHTDERCGHDLYLMDGHDNVSLCQYCDEHHVRTRWCAERCDVAREEIIMSVVAAKRTNDIPSDPTTFADVITSLRVAADAVADGFNAVAAALRLDRAPEDTAKAMLELAPLLVTFGDQYRQYATRVFTWLNQR